MQVLIEVFDEKWNHVTPITLELSGSDYKGQLIRVDSENDLSYSAKEYIKSQGFNFIKVVNLEDLMFIDFEDMHKDDYVDISGIIWFSRKMGDKALRLLIMVD